MNRCIICSGKDRIAVDKAILKGGNLRSISKEFNVPYQSLYAHSKNHIHRQLVRCVETQLAVEGNELMQVITKIIERADLIFERNFEAGHDLTALRALDSTRNTIQLLNNISAQVTANKKLEYEIAKETRGEGKEEQERLYREQLAILNMEELQVYQRINNKIVHQNADKIISGGRVLALNRPKTE